MSAGDMSGASETSGESGHVPNQLAVLVPTFDPAQDNVELLLLTWPQSKILELATRLVLGCIRAQPFRSCSCTATRSW